MNDMEKPTFEENLREAFRGAEAGPSENVWNNIELDLMKAESNKMRRRVLFYQLLAAASITFALLTIGISWYGNRTDISKNPQIAASNNVGNADRNNANDAPTGSEKSISEESEDMISGNASQTAQQERNTASSERANGVQSSKESFDSKIAGATNTDGNNAASLAAPTVNNSIPDKNDDSINQLETINNSENFNDLQLLGASENDRGLVSSDALTQTGQSDQTERDLPSLYEKRELDPKPTGTKPEESVADPGALLLAKLKDLENELAGKSSSKKKGKDVKENLWTSVGFAAGGFNTTNPKVSSSSPSNLAFSNTVDNQSKASGVSYSFGLSMGTRLSERFVIQGGVNYLTQNSNYMSEQVVSSSDLSNFKTATLNDFREAGSSARVISTAPYSVNNNVEFFSVPMQAGYVVINRKFALQLNAGVSTDFYLKNTIDPEGSGLEKTTQERGADSPYRSLNFSGLMNTELSYRLSDRYRVSINPGLRYPFNSIYKDEIGIEASPLTFDVGLRFKYIFQ